MFDVAYPYRLNGHWFVLGLFGYGLPAMLLANAASKGRYPPFFVHALGQRPSPEVILLEWLGCAIFGLGVIYTCYRFHFPKASARGLIHLTKGSISIPISASGEMVTIPYKTITKLQSSTIYRGGRVINIWHENGALMISEALLVTDSFDEIYERLRAYVPE